MPKLFLRLGAPAGREQSGSSFDSKVEWLALGDDGRPLGQGEGDRQSLARFVAEAAPWAGQDPAHVVAFVPTASTLALTCRVPGRSATQLRRALPYAVEEFLAEDIEGMHVASGPLARGVPVRCLVAPADDLRRWLDALAEAGLRPGFLTADAMALPSRPNLVSIAFDDDSVLVRGGEALASVERAHAALVLASISREGADAHALCQIGGALPDVALAEAGFAPERAERVPADSLLPFLAQSFEPEAAVNLLQGPYAVRTDSAVAQRWRPVAVAAGILLALVVADLGVEWLWANHRADALREEARALYRDIYEVESAPSNFLARMRAGLGEQPTAGAPPAFHQRLAAVGAALASLAGRHDLLGVSYRDGDFGADLRVADYDALEALQAALEGRGFALQVVSAEQQQDRVRASVRVRTVGDAGS